MSLVWQLVSWEGTHLDNFLTQQDKVVDGILLGNIELGVLEQSSPVLIGHAVFIHDVERDDADLIEPAAGIVKVRSERGRDSRQRDANVRDDGLVLAQEGNHVLDEALWRLALGRNAGRAVLRHVGGCQHAGSEEFESDQ